MSTEPITVELPDMAGGTVAVVTLNQMELSNRLVDHTPAPSVVRLSANPAHGRAR